MLRPYRALWGGAGFTQGFTLGFHMAPFQGFGGGRVMARGGDDGGGWGRGVAVGGMVRLGSETQEYEGDGNPMGAARYYRVVLVE